MAASESSYKVESGVQLLARLSRKPIIENFYPELFQSGPKQSEVIEMYSSDEITCLLVDITCAALLNSSSTGFETGVLIFNCSGHFNDSTIISCLRYKIESQFSTFASSNKSAVHNSNKKIEDLMQKMLNNLFILEIYDSSQLYITIHNLENILMEHPNISMVIFDTITAFYWSEQSKKIMKMDTYLKKILHKIQKVTREHKVTIIYSRPEHFTSTKDTMESMEVCCENPTMERVNYKINIMYTSNGIYKVNIKTFQKQIKKQFRIVDTQIEWE